MGAAVLKGEDVWAARLLGARDAVTERTGSTAVNRSVLDLKDEAGRQVRDRLGKGRISSASPPGAEPPFSR